MTLTKRRKKKIRKAGVKAKVKRQVEKARAENQNS